MTVVDGGDRGKGVHEMTRDVLGVAVREHDAYVRQIAQALRDGEALEAAHSAVEKVTAKLSEHFTNHSEKFKQAFQKASYRAWKTLEFALADRRVVRIAATE